MVNYLGKTYSTLPSIKADVTIVSCGLYVSTSILLRFSLYYDLFLIFNSSLFVKKILP